MLIGFDTVQAPHPHAHLELLAADLGYIFSCKIRLHHALLLQLVCVTLQW